MMAGPLQLLHALTTMLCVLHVQCFLTVNPPMKGTSHSNTQASGTKKTLDNPDTHLNRRFYTDNFDLTLSKWPNGEVLWCLVQEWPDDVPIFQPFVVNNQLDWVTINKHVHDAIEDAMWAWNPDKSAGIWHKSYGMCPDKEGAALRVNVGKVFKGPHGAHPVSKADGLTFKPLNEDDELGIRGWRHEWGHVLGFYHEHQRPDLWRDDHQAFRLMIDNAQDYNTFFTCENGMVRGRVIPEDVRQWMNMGAMKDQYRPYQPIPEGGTFDFELMSTNAEYARYAGASWYPFLPWALGGIVERFVMGDKRIGDGLLDLDAIMLYSTKQAVWEDPTLPKTVNGGWRIIWALNHPRLDPATGKMTVVVPANIKPSDNEKTRLRAMYPAKDE